MKELRCSICGDTEPKHFEPKRKGKCSKCRNQGKYLRRQVKQAEYYRRWYAERGRKRSPDYKEIIILWRKNNQDKVKAGRKLRKAIKAGLIEKPLTCIFCGRKAKIQGHHEDYTCPYEVLWLCASCHKTIHLTPLTSPPT